MAKVQYFFTGTAAPTTTPANAGAVFVDTTGGRIYFATGTASSSDWDLMPVNISEITQDADMNQQGVRSLINAMAIDFQASAELTLNTGAVTQTQSLHSIDTQSDSAADDLDTVTIATDKNFMILKLEDAARIVTIKHGTGNFSLPGGNDLIMAADSLYQFIYDGTNWLQLVGSAGGAGTGDVVGPASAVDENVAVFNSTTGKIIEDSGINKSAITANTAKNTYPSGDAAKVAFISVTQAVDLDTMESDIAAAGDVSGPASAVDSNFAGFDSTTGKLLKDSGSAASDFATAAQGTTADTALQNIVDDTTPQLGGTLDTNSKQVRLSKGADVASGTALTLGTDGNYFDITGTTTITSIATLAVGTEVTLHFDGIVTLTYHATDLILPSAADITTAAGDEFTFIEYATGDWRCTSYALASGSAIVGAAGGGNFPTSTDSGDKTTAYSVIAGDENTTVVAGSATAADFTITYDLSLWTTAGSLLTIANESAYIVKVLVSNTGTMTIGGGIDAFVGPNETITMSADTATHVRVVART